jgi:starch phosphorylase
MIIAGKAHPADQAGQALIQKWIQFIRQPAVRPHAIFLSDYDMQLTERLVQGVDVWINTPRRPWEACGTSGMKVLVNGGINLSELDGWRAEAFFPDLGRALGDGQEHGSDPAWDAAEAEVLDERLEREVIREFYTRNEQGIPTAWVAQMRESMARLTPLVSADRAVREYTEQHYLPAAIALRSRVANKGVSGRQMVDGRHSLEQKWGGLRFGEVKVETKGQQHVFDVQVYLNDLDPKALQVELYADAINGGSPTRQEMKPIGPLVGAAGGYDYSAVVSAARPSGDYTARVIPHCDGVAIPLEDPRILWQR